MVKTLPTPPADPATLPARIPLPMVLALCGYGRVTLWRRIRRGQMPEAVDRGRDGLIWMRDDVLRALGLIGERPLPLEEDDPWIRAADAIRLEREIEQAEKRARRKVT
jgi:predicted DNA-binding transcriptional regulator AlpA